MSEPILIENDIFVTELRYALTQGKTGLGGVPGLLKRVLQEERWKRRVIQQTGEIVEFDTFTEFVTTPPLEGLGADVALIYRICRDDTETVDLLDRVTTGKPGAPAGNQNAAIEKTNSDNITICFNESERGTSQRYALRRLRRERPDLHEQVLVGEMSANAAMIEAKFRTKTITIPIDPERAAGSIQRHFSVTQIRHLVELLS